MRKEAAPEFFGRTREELAELLRTECSIPERFRAEQLYEWLYARRARAFAEMTNLPLAIRAALEVRYSIPSLPCAHVSESADGTKKFLFSLEDGRSIET
ncbi:MAG TPA: 23S rRNA (adenine(2503)-C(2))-methyltransferase RlmN, partial [Candidatus Kapabacteria bacterium]|nr:23S rRNA (adenine(2503)-C(2))-methyltransferase RlmN [Candidatus Kapabacteria bacterium]